ncbi:MAG: transcriptional repressor [Desulfovibrionaceae bacterium]|nr:transcriptional repressor [Desulfovibrionaceae bacterium]
MSQVQTRMTRQRAVILEELRKNKSHPTADELYSIVRERLPRISLGTVYRNLDFLADTGEILRLESAGSIKRFDGNIVSHQHIRCVKCGRIGDIIPPLDTPAFDGLTVHGFAAVHEARVEFDGLCEHCAAHQSEPQ